MQYERLLVDTVVFCGVYRYIGNAEIVVAGGMGSMRRAEFYIPG